MPLLFSTHAAKLTISWFQNKTLIKFPLCQIQTVPFFHFIVLVFNRVLIVHFIPEEHRNAASNT